MRIAPQLGAAAHVQPWTRGGATDVVASFCGAFADAAGRRQGIQLVEARGLMVLRDN